MKKLEKQFKGGGDVNVFIFEQIKESEKGYLFAVYGQPGIITHYEIFYKRIQEAGSYEIAGRTVILEHKELYPKSENFGIDAWTTEKLESAIKIFNAL